MRVFKFGGASVKNADAVRNVKRIMDLYSDQQILIVVSAIDKTTNALEEVARSFYNHEGNAANLLKSIKDFHFNILDQLFEPKQHQVFEKVNNAFVEIEWIIEEDPKFTYAHEYDQIVSMGEIISSIILSEYLNYAGITNIWKDARGLIQTDNNYREGNVDWDLTEELIQKQLTPVFEKTSVILTQGFIAGTSENFTTTLGREGSDYSAAIFAYCLDAETMTIWKDVPGVLNADPKFFSDTTILEKLSFQDAIELSYYGATVIHPKTIKPLQNKNIPLEVKSFLQPESKGTLISEETSNPVIPSFIFKVNQALISLSPKDFSFIVEENLSKIFATFASKGIKINMMQNSAISFSACFDNHEDQLRELLDELQKDYRIRYNDNLKLITIRYYDQPTIDRITDGQNILVEQKSRNTVQIVVNNN